MNNLLLSFGLSLMEEIQDTLEYGVGNGAQEVFLVKFQDGRYRAAILSAMIAAGLIEDRGVDGVWRYVRLTPKGWDKALLEIKEFVLAVEAETRRQGDDK